MACWRKENKYYVKQEQISNQLTLNDRLKIQVAIEMSKSAQEIASNLNVTRQTIYREIKRNRKAVSIRSTSNACFCKHRIKCPYLATYQHQGMTVCIAKCEHYEYDVCEQLSLFPFCCNACRKKTYCNKDKYYYQADKSELMSIKRRKETRQGIRISKDDFTYINDIVSSLILKGQSIEHILTNHKEIDVSSVTIRKWINEGYMDARNIDLHRKVSFKVKKQYIPRVIKNPELLIGRTFKDYKQWILTNHLHTVQIDTVHGLITDNKFILTIHFPDIHFQFGILLNCLSPNEVNSVFQIIKSKLGNKQFKTIFPIILCDNGFEFLKLSELEIDQDNGENLTKIFYCDPYRSSQKGACERNHELIRYIKKKGNSFNNLSQDDIDLMFSHINSLSRKSIMGKTPYELAVSFLGQTFLNIINIKKIDPDNVHLRPDLFSTER